MGELSCPKLRYNKLKFEIAHQLAYGNLLNSYFILVQVLPTSGCRTNSGNQSEIQWANFHGWIPSGSHGIRTSEPNQERTLPNRIRLGKFSPGRLRVHHLVVDWTAVGATGKCIWLKIGYVYARWNPKSCWCKLCQHRISEQTPVSKVKFGGRAFMLKPQQDPLTSKSSHLFIYGHLQNSYVLLAQMLSTSDFGTNSET